MIVGEEKPLFLKAERQQNTLNKVFPILQFPWDYLPDLVADTAEQSVCLRFLIGCFNKPFL